MINQKKKTLVICSDCGAELFVRNDYLKTHKGRCQSCAKIFDWTKDEYANKCMLAQVGYDRPGLRLPYGEANFNALYGSYKRSAQSRGIDFNLTREQFKLLTKENCYYCGVEPLQKFDEKRSKWAKTGYWIYNGIDRKNDDLPYEINNCVPSCKICNYAKQGLTDSEFISHVYKIYKNHYQIDTIGSRTEYSK